MGYGESYQVDRPFLAKQFYARSYVLVSFWSPGIDFRSISAAVPVRVGFVQLSNSRIASRTDEDVVFAAVVDVCSRRHRHVRHHTGLDGNS